MTQLLLNRQQLEGPGEDHVRTGVSCVGGVLAWHLSYFDTRMQVVQVGLELLVLLLEAPKG